ncbi:hypothetical protein [Streptomyces sp. NPDC056291]|uniref:hypothetical protein n=1 Tax=Streptomyces sp. NPDC056291 TaxID=3345772 RepID=UPI0035E17C47
MPAQLNARGNPGKAGAVGVVPGYPDHPGRSDYPRRQRGQSDGVDVPHLGGTAELSDVTVEYAVGQQQTVVGPTSAWRTAPVTGSGTSWTAVLDQSAAAGQYVSVRVTAKAADGSTVQQAVVRAYPVR